RRDSPGVVQRNYEKWTFWTGPLGSMLRAMKTRLNEATRSRMGDWPLLLIPGVIWGASFLFIAEALRAVGPNGVTFARILVGVASGLAIGMVGGVLIALPTIHDGHSSTVGVLYIFAALASYGVALNLARPLQQTYGAMPVLWRAQALALILTAPLGIPEVQRA